MCPSIVHSGVLRDKTMDDKLMYIPNINTLNEPYFKLNYYLKTLDSIGLELTNHNNRINNSFLVNE